MYEDKGRRIIESPCVAETVPTRRRRVTLLETVEVCLIVLAVMIIVVGIISIPAILW
jgi:hypothetical protein